MGPLYLGKMGTFANFRYINNLAMISTSVLSTLHITMNPNMNYYLVITDSKLQATSIGEKRWNCQLCVKGKYFFSFLFDISFLCSSKKKFYTSGYTT